MRKLLELRTGLVHVDDDDIGSRPGSSTMCGLDSTALEPKDGYEFTEDEINDELCPAMKRTTDRITCPTCLALAKFVLENAKEFKTAIRFAEKGANDER